MPDKRRRLILNQSKTKVLLLGSWQNLCKSPNFCIQLYGKTLKRVAKVSFLGVVLEENLSWTDHVEYVSSKVSRRLGYTIMPHAGSILNRFTFTLAAIIWLCWCCLGEISEGCCKELQRLQNRAARIILRKKISNDTFRVLNWLNLASRRKMHKRILVF